MKDLIPSIWHGITPAYAGKSVKFTAFVGKIRDHPRLCGEKL